MNLRRIQLTVISGVFFVLFITVGAARPSGEAAVARREAPAAVAAAVAAVRAAPAAVLAANWMFEGCWSYFPSGGCRDIFRDAQGTYWRCGNCGTTQNPSSRTCSRISQQTLATGYWCS